MGNRAVIAFESMPSVGLYLHWNGGPGSVLAFIREAQERGARSPGEDETYSFARLAQVALDFLTGEDGDKYINYDTSVGIGPLNNLDTVNGDNGVYWIGDDWTITRREFSEQLPMNERNTMPDRDRETYDGVREVLRRTRLREN